LEQIARAVWEGTGSEGNDRAKRAQVVAVRSAYMRIVRAGCSASCETHFYRLLSASPNIKNPSSVTLTHNYQLLRVGATGRARAPVAPFDIQQDA
jgi:hypothetical protein